MNLTTLGNSCKWNCTLFVFLWLVYLTWHNVLRLIDVTACVIIFLLFSFFLKQYFPLYKGLFFLSIVCWPSEKTLSWSEPQPANLEFLSQTFNQFSTFHTSFHHWIGTYVVISIPKPSQVWASSTLLISSITGVQIVVFLLSDKLVTTHPPFHVSEK